MSKPSLLSARFCRLGGRIRGFTLLELMATCAVSALLLALAIPSYRSITDGMKSKTAVADLRSLGLRLQKFALGHDERYPLTLTEIDGLPLLDPWGNPYQYLNLTDPAAGGRPRKDHNLHPINTYFDLYSMGPDAQTNAPLTAKASRDDIIWANDGSFVGVASDY